MSKSKFLLLLCASVLQGQISFVPGLPGDTFCPLPVSPCRNGATCLYTDASVTPTSTLLYGFGGFPFTCTVPAAAPKVDVVLGFYEPNKTAAGQRVFNVSVNGGGALSVDVFSLVGLKKYTTITVPGVSTAGGVVRISFTGTTGNAMVSTVALIMPPPPEMPPPVEINERHVSIKPSVGTNTVTVPDGSFIPESLVVTVNGLTMSDAAGDDYTVIGTVLTFVRPFQAGDIVRLGYRF